MPFPYTGGCQCGQIRYEIQAEPLTLYVCHCTECQRQSSSAFGMSMPVPRDAVKLSQGTPKQWSRPAASGRTVICFFCGECGTRLFHQPTRNNKITNIKPGTLDDTSWLQPVGNLWTTSAQPWIPLSDNMVNIEQQPKSEESAEMCRRFKKKP
ncbi:MAG: GFA family protein [Cyanobacteria bacterium J06656_5]